MNYMNDPNDPRYMNRIAPPSSSIEQPVQPAGTYSTGASMAGNNAIANDPTIQKGPTPDPFAARNALAKNYPIQGIIGRAMDAVGGAAKSFGEYTMQSGTDAIANTILNTKDLVAPYNPYNGVGYQAPTPQAPVVMPKPSSGDLSKVAAGQSNTPQLQMNGLKLPTFDYTKFRPQGVDVQGLAGQARDFGGQINLGQFNDQLNGNLQQNGSREDNFNAQINDIMGQLAQSKDEINKHIGSIGSAGSFSGILQAKLLAKDATAKRSQLQGALNSILQARIGANDANRNNLQTLGLNATNAQATNAADYTQSLGKNILNDGIQKDINNNATQNDVAKTVANEQFSSDAKAKQFDLAQKQRMEATRVAYANAKPGSPEAEQLARQMAIEAGGTGIVEPNVMKVSTLARDKDNNVVGTTDKLVSIGKNKNTGGVDARTVYDSEREATLQQAANRIADLNRLDKSKGLSNKEKEELSYYTQMMPTK